MAAGREGRHDSRKLAGYLSTSQQAERDQKIGLGYKTASPSPSDSLPPMSIHSLKASTTYSTALLAGDQAFKHSSHSSLD